uniref:SCP domain-containing protein n=1 Tax=Elaeophora elaphi TaxID=1147741 RepID=A0A0R3RIJ2_9BILA
MNGCYKAILLFVLASGQVEGLDGKDLRIHAIERTGMVNDNIERDGLKYLPPNENVGLISLSETNRKDKRPSESTWRCGDDRSYYFELLNECYLISEAQFLNIDPDRKIAYGGTRNEYMFNCWQQYRGRLLDIGSKHIAEKMNFVKEMIIDFNHRSFNRQAIQVGFMINRKYELISQNGEHYELLDEEHRNHAASCPSVCCIVFLANTRATVDVKMVYTTCDNRTRAMSYICEAPALT